MFMELNERCKDLSLIKSIPSTWNFQPIKHLIISHDGGAWGDEENHDKNDCICIRIADFDYLKRTVKENVELTIRNYKSNQIEKLKLQDGDIIIEKSGGGDKLPVGRTIVFHQNYDAVFANFSERIRVKMDYNSDFVNYCLMAFYFIGGVYNFFNQTTGIQNLSTKMYLGDIYLPCPNRNIQNQIVSYLDAKCDAIDKAITHKRSVIEKLKEYRTAVITKAVTKGLNPDVKMKNSGIVWIGQIPINWQISKIKFLIETGENGMKIGPFGSALKGVTLSKGPVKIYNQANLIAENFDISKHYISAETYEKLKSYTINAGDILFSMMGTIGKCRIMPKGKPIGIMDSHLLKARLNTNKVLPEFFVYVFDKDRNPATLEQLIYSSQGSIMNGLNSSIVKTIKLAVPDIKEQQQIVDYLDAKCSKIDSAIQQQEQIIAKLEEYRKSVIYYAVTGKKEVSA